MLGTFPSQVNTASYCSDQLRLESRWQEGTWPPPPWEFYLFSAFPIIRFYLSSPLISAICKNNNKEKGFDPRSIPWEGWRVWFVAHGLSREMSVEGRAAETLVQQEVYRHVAWESVCKELARAILKPRGSIAGGLSAGGGSVRMGETHPPCPARR